MNRLVSYSESSDDDERGLSSPEKYDCSASSGVCSTLCNKNIYYVNCKSVVFQSQSQFSKNETQVHQSDTNLNTFEKNHNQNVCSSSRHSSESESGKEFDRISAINTAAAHSNSNLVEVEANESGEQKVCNIKEDCERFPVGKPQFSCNKDLGSENVRDISLVSNLIKTDCSKSTLVSLDDTKDKKDDGGYAKQSKTLNVVSRSVPVNISGNFNSTRKRKHSNNDNSDKKPELHLPDSLKTMFHERCHKWVDDPAEHDNRIRSFPHLEGNWAAHVFFPVPQNKVFEEFVHALLQIFEPLAFKAFPEYHISLSRTVPIRHHWIEPIVTSLREQLKPLKSGISEMTAIKLFTNDEKTRTFICIELSQDDTEFSSYVSAVDKCFIEFKLPVYYENPSFHISIGWCLGDVIPDIPEEKLVLAKVMLGEFMAENPELSVVLLQQVFCRAGNKLFAITLEDEHH